VRAAGSLAAMRALAPWVALAAATGAAGAALGAAGVPSSYLFGALLLGLAVAIAWPEHLEVRARGFAAAQAVTGVTLGAYLQSSALSAVGRSWLPVLLASAATLLLSLTAGVALARFTGTDTRTASLGMVAGGASGIVGMADDLGGDDRLVAFCSTCGSSSSCSSRRCSSRSRSRATAPAAPGPCPARGRCSAIRATG